MHKNECEVQGEETEVVVVREKVLARPSTFIK